MENDSQTSSKSSSPGTIHKIVTLVVLAFVYLSLFALSGMATDSCGTSEQHLCTYSSYAYIIGGAWLLIGYFLYARMYLVGFKAKFLYAFYPIATLVIYAVIVQTIVNL